MLPRAPLLFALVAISCGRLGFDGTHTDDAPTDVPRGCVASYVAYGDQICAVRFDGALYCWGDGSKGQLGDATFTGRSTPQPASIANVAFVASGEDTVCAIDTVGAVSCWGANDRGQVGDGTLMNRATPRLVSLPGPVAEVRGAEDHTCARLVDGTGYCWGANAVGQLGTDPGTPQQLPVRALPVDGSTTFTLGDYFGCTLDGTPGTVTCWGRNMSGELGDGTATPRQTAAPVVGIPDPVVQVTAGCHEHACAVTTAGDVYCWGNNEQGQTGKGATSPFETLPIRVVGIPPAVQVAVGAFHSCSRSALDEVWCWGTNTDGVLGNGTFDSSLTAVQVNGALGNIVDLQGACNATFALRKDATLIGWGSARFFSETTIDEPLPVEVDIPCP